MQRQEKLCIVVTLFPFQGSTTKSYRHHALLMHHLLIRISLHVHQCPIYSFWVGSLYAFRVKVQMHPVYWAFYGRLRLLELHNMLKQNTKVQENVVLIFRYTEILEVNTFAFVYRLFHEDLSTEPSSEEKSS